MQAIPTQLLKPGTMISHDIYNQKGILLLPKGKRLTEDNIRSLILKGIEEVYVLEEFQKVTDLEEAYEEVIHAITSVFAEAILEQSPDQQEVKEAAKLLTSVAGRHSVMSQIRALFAKNNYLFNHSVNVAFLAITLGKWLKLQDDELIDLGIAALLHDIGMAGIPDEMFHHPGELTPEAKEVIRTHPQKAETLLTDFSPVIRKAILQHHERLDGSGYPAGINGTQISAYARIIAVADVFDSLTAERAYRGKKTPYEAISIIRSLCFNQLDPTAGLRFCTMLAYSFVGDQVLLDNGSIGEIIWVDAADPSHLLVRTKSEQIYDTGDPSSPKVKELMNFIQSNLYE